MKRLSRLEFGNLINASAKQGDEHDSDVEMVGAPMVKKALAAQKAKDEEALQAEILAALDMVRTIRENKVQKIRKLRKAVDKLLSDLKVLENAEKQGIASGDFRDLLVACGHPVPGVKGESVADVDDHNDYA